MNYRSLAMTLLIAACAPQPDGHQRTDRYTKVDPGAILSVQLENVSEADKLMDEVQSALLAHPEWAGQTAYHGMDPPSGYSYKFKGRCSARPAAAVAVARLMRQAGAGAPRCQEVGY